MLLRGWIGDRVRDGEDNARELALTMAACNQWFEWDGRPFAFVREGDDVFLEARFRREDVTEDELVMITLEFEQALFSIPGVVEDHMEPLHDEEDDDCVCPPCRERHRGAMTPEELQSYLGAQEEWSRICGMVAFD